MEEPREHKKRALNRLDNLNDGESFDHFLVLKRFCKNIFDVFKRFTTAIF